MGQISVNIIKDPSVRIRWARLLSILLRILCQDQVGQITVNIIKDPVSVSGGLDYCQY